MVYKFFDQKSASLADKCAVGSGIKSMPQNEQFAEELHKPIIREFKKKEKCIQHLKTTFGVLI